MKEVMMRQVTHEEAERWTAKAREYGFVNAEGNIALGRFVLERDETGQLYVEFVTPCPAGFYDEELRPKTPPILFDRTPTGGIILPGRWWQLTFERLSEDEAVPAEVRKGTALMSRGVEFGDAILPPDTDTISFLAPDWEGELVQHEALPPGTRVGPISLVSK
jgi:hypothetical protein